MSWEDTLLIKLSIDAKKNVLTKVISKMDPLFLTVRLETDMYIQPITVTAKFKEDYQQNPDELYTMFKEQRDLATVINFNLPRMLRHGVK